MGRGAHFNRANRRSGGNRAVPLLVNSHSQGMREVYLAILKAKFSTLGMADEDLEEVFFRLECTETDVLRDCVREKVWLTEEPNTQRAHDGDTKPPSPLEASADQKENRP